MIESLLNLGGDDLIVLLIIVLLLFGAKKLPELARGLGQAVKEFSRAKDEFESEVAGAERAPDADGMSWKTCSILLGAAILLAALLYLWP